MALDSVSPLVPVEAVAPVLVMPAFDVGDVRNFAVLPVEASASVPGLALSSGSSSSVEPVPAGPVPELGLAVVFAAAYWPGSGSSSPTVAPASRPPGACIVPGIVSQWSAPLRLRFLLCWGSSRIYLSRT